MLLSFPQVDLRKLKGNATLEFKLAVVNHCCENNLYQTSKRFSLNMKTIFRWAGDEEKLKKAKKGSKRTVRARKWKLNFTKSINH